MDRMQRKQPKGLERQPLETMGLDKHGLVCSLEEEAVILKLDLAGEGWGCEACKRASSCSATDHG